MQFSYSCAGMLIAVNLTRCIGGPATASYAIKIDGYMIAPALEDTMHYHTVLAVLLDTWLASRVLRWWYQCLLPPRPHPYPRAWGIFVLYTRGPNFLASADVNDPQTCTSPVVVTSESPLRLQFLLSRKETHSYTLICFIFKMLYETHIKLAFEIYITS